MKYVIQKQVAYKINTFYHNVAKKYKHTYSEEMMHKNLDNAFNSIYKIENGLLRRKPTISRWNGLFMANAGNGILLTESKAIQYTLRMPAMRKTCTKCF